VALQKLLAKTLKGQLLSSHREWSKHWPTTEEDSEVPPAPSPATLKRWIEEPDKYLTITRLQTLCSTIPVNILEYVSLELAPGNELLLSEIVGKVEELSSLLRLRTVQESKSEEVEEVNEPYELFLFRQIFQQQEVLFLIRDDDFRNQESSRIVIPEATTRHRSLLRADRLVVCYFRKNELLYRQGAYFIIAQEQEDERVTLRVDMITTYKEQPRANLNEQGFHNTVGIINTNDWKEIKSELFCDQEATVLFKTMLEVEETDSEIRQTLAKVLDNKVIVPEKEILSILVLLSIMVNGENNNNCWNIGELGERVLTSDSQWGNRYVSFKKQQCPSPDKYRKLDRETIVSIVYHGAKNIGGFAKVTYQHNVKREYELQQSRIYEQERSSIDVGSIESTKIFLVMLRSPNTHDPSEKRSDPFYELGSFGMTRSHQKILMNPKRLQRFSGASIAFAQGGPEGVKLIILTPPVSVHLHELTGELKWDVGEEYRSPFKYHRAPVLASNSGETDFPLLKDYFDKVTSRPTDVSKFVSRFRSRGSALDDHIAVEIYRVFTQKHRAAADEDLAEYYWETMPYDPPCKDFNRKDTYNRYLNRANHKL